MDPDIEQRGMKSGLTDKKRFIPVNNDCGVLATQSMDGIPSYTITLSAR